MTYASPETIWGDKLELVDESKPDHIFNLRLKDNASEDEKKDFEQYVMEMGQHFLVKMYPHYKKPRYTWEGVVIDLSPDNGGI